MAVGKHDYTVLGLEDYWTVCDRDEIIASFDTEEEAVAYCEQLESE